MDCQLRSFLPGAEDSATERFEQLRKDGRKAYRRPQIAKGSYTDGSPLPTIYGMGGALKQTISTHQAGNGHPAAIITEEGRKACPVDRGVSSSTAKPKILSGLAHCDRLGTERHNPTCTRSIITSHFHGKKILSDSENYIKRAIKNTIRRIIPERRPE